MAYIMLLDALYCFYVTPTKMMFYLSRNLPISVDHCKLLGLFTSLIEWKERLALGALVISQAKLLEPGTNAEEIFNVVFWIITVLPTYIIIPFLIGVEKMDDWILDKFGYVPALGICTLYKQDIVIAEWVITGTIVAILLIFNYFKGRLTNFLKDNKMNLQGMTLLGKRFSDGALCLLGSTQSTAS